MYHLQAFDTLVDLNIFVPVASANAIASGEMREYCKHRCSIENGEIRQAVEKRKDIPTALYKWGHSWN